jgi:hypothetical protein
MKVRLEAWKIVIEFNPNNKLDNIIYNKFLQRGKMVGWIRTETHIVVSPISKGLQKSKK